MGIREPACCPPRSGGEGTGQDLGKNQVVGANEEIVPLYHLAFSLSSWGSGLWCGPSPWCAPAGRSRGLVGVAK